MEQTDYRANKLYSLINEMVINPQMNKGKQFVFGKESP